MSSFRNIQRKGYAVPFAGRKTVFEYSDEEYSSDDETKEEEPIKKQRQSVVVPKKRKKKKEEDNSTNVVEFTHGGVTYWKDSWGNLYDPETQEQVGFWNKKTRQVEETYEETDEETDEEECSEEDIKKSEEERKKILEEAKVTILDMRARKSERDFKMKGYVAPEYKIQSGCMPTRNHYYGLTRGLQYHNPLIYAMIIQGLGIITVDDLLDDQVEKDIKNGRYRIETFTESYRQEHRWVNENDIRSYAKPISEKYFLHEYGKDKINLTDSKFYNYPFKRVKEGLYNPRWSNTRYKTKKMIVSVLLDTHNSKLYNLSNGNIIGEMKCKSYENIYSKKVSDYIDRDEEKTGKMSLHEFVERHSKILKKYGMVLKKPKGYNSYSHRLSVGVTICKDDNEEMIGSFCDDLEASLRMVNYKKWPYSAEKLFKSIINSKFHPNYYAPVYGRNYVKLY